MLGDRANAFKRFEESVELVDRAFQQFRAQQTIYGGNVTHTDKQELRNRLAKLDAELDRYLAGEYGVKVTRQKDFDAWKISHQPFHWFVEFYGIMHTGGFDVIIGNPPYVELKVLKAYRLVGYGCESAGNLYALMLERSFRLESPIGRMGFIVPVSSISTDRYEPLQKLLSTQLLHYSSFDDRPSRLFDGLEHIRLTIHLLGSLQEQAVSYSTRYNKWSMTKESYCSNCSHIRRLSPPLYSEPCQSCPTKSKRALFKNFRSDKGQLFSLLCKEWSSQNLLFPESRLFPTGS